MDRNNRCTATRPCMDVELIYGDKKRGKNSFFSPFRRDLFFAVETQARERRKRRKEIRKLDDKRREFEHFSYLEHFDIFGIIEHFS